MEQYSFYQTGRASIKISHQQLFRNHYLLSTRQMTFSIANTAEKYDQTITYWGLVIPIQAFSLLRFQKLLMRALESIKQFSVRRKPQAFSHLTSHLIEIVDNLSLAPHNWYFPANINIFAAAIAVINEVTIEQDFHFPVIKQVLRILTLIGDSHRLVLV